ncbi:MAG: hypothetical protein O3A84_15045 [Proteobacteria bacterium]|nr:hypothetical protein [Pseudomonadota bacterium]
MGMLLLLVACSPTSLLSDTPNDVPIENPAEIVDAVDWEVAETFNIDIRQGEFRPTIIRLLQGEPYIMVIENRDDVDHLFVAKEFFRTIAIRKMVTDEKEIKIDRLTGINVEPGRITELHFVPVRDGWYPFEDAAPGFFVGGVVFAFMGRGATHGAVGAIIVEE